MEEQLDSRSPNYHRWLTPEQFGRQFGPSWMKIRLLMDWLESPGFTIDSLSEGRTIIEFSGTAAAVEKAFGAQIRIYAPPNGTAYYANASELRLPAAFDRIVAGIRSMNNFSNMPKPSMLHKSRRPNLTLRQSPPGCGMQPTDCYAIGPRDFGLIYDALPLWKAGIDGTGQTIAVIGESNINLQDTRNFRRLFGLPPKDPVVIVNGRNPGLTGNELELEASTDVEWSGAVAPNADIVLVTSATTNSSFGGDLSAVYAVNRNLAPIMTYSYNDCEQRFGANGNQFYNSLWQQAAARGITVFVSSGDNGSAGCEDFTKQPPWPAQSGLAVSGVAATPWNVAVGGTDYDDVNQPSQYWNSVNDSITRQSAKGYIPETTWNLSCTNRILATQGYSTDIEANCNNPRLLEFVRTVGGSGGRSSIYRKPSWQAGPGVPNDNVRDIPDVSLFAGLGRISGTFYVVCMQNMSAGKAPCDLLPPYAHFVTGGGTSLTTPAFAGIIALISHYNKARQGNANAVFYRLAADQVGTGCESNGPPGNHCIFRDITSGSISMPCVRGTSNCLASSSSVKYGALSGFDAAPGYDLATGLGSVDIFNPVTAGGWEAQTVSVPVLENGSVVNGASFEPSTAVAPGSIAAVFGDFPVPDTAVAEGSILPPMLAKVVVKTGPGAPAPLYFVSPHQVNIQVPWELAGLTDAPISVVLEGKSTERRSFRLALSAPGIFSTNGQGTGQGSVLDSRYQLVDGTNPVARGDIVEIYCTGLGKVSNQPPTGVPAPSSEPLSRTIDEPEVLIGGALAPVLYSGLAPGFVGLYQVNVRIPETATRGPATPS